MGMHDARRYGDRNMLGPIQSRVAQQRLAVPSGPRQIDGFNEPFRYGVVDDQPMIERAVLDAHYTPVDGDLPRKD